MTYFILPVYDIIQHCYISTYFMAPVNDIMKMISCMISYDNYIMTLTYIHILTSMVADPGPLAVAVPADMSSEDDDDSDRDHGLPDPHDDDDFGHCGGASRAQARPLDPLARFIQELYRILYCI